MSSWFNRIKNRLQGGKELVDPTPMQIPVGFIRPEPLSAQIQRLVRSEISRRATEEGYESFEEAEDFEIEDEYFDPSSPWEMNFDPEEQKRHFQAVRDHKRRPKEELEEEIPVKPSKKAQAKPVPKKGKAKQMELDASLEPESGGESED